MLKKTYILIGFGLAIVVFAGLAIACEHTTPIKVLSNTEKTSMYGGCDRCHQVTLCSDVPCGDPPCGTRYWRQTCSHCAYSTDPDLPTCSPGDSEGCGSERPCVEKGGNCVEKGDITDCSSVRECD
jgi:hypothetical protein